MRLPCLSQPCTKIPEPTNPAASRGSKIHEQAEAYVKGELGEMPEELKKFAQDLIIFVRSMQMHE